MKAPRIFRPEYYDRMRELEERSWWNAAMRDIAAMLLATVKLPEEGTLLDVGCGSGQTMSWFESLFPGWRTLGMDVMVDGLLAARRSDVTAVCKASALSLPYPDRCVELIVMLDVLQHLPLGGGDQAALSEVHRVLKPAGHLLVRTNAQTFPRAPDDPSYNFHKYAPAELRARLSEAGFQVLRLSRLNAVLGLAEIRRELQASRAAGAGYHGILADAPRHMPRWPDRLKRGWLRVEGRAVRAGLNLPLGRSVIALCRAGS